ncbi:hypothetical protein D9M69_587140 [compost metagenome]
MARQADNDHTDNGNRRAETQRVDGTETVTHNVACKAHDRHGHGEGREAKTGNRYRCTHFIAQIIGTPIEYRAFRDHREKSNDTHQPWQSIAWQNQLLFFTARMMELVGNDRRPGAGE